MMPITTHHARVGMFASQPVTVDQLSPNNFFAKLVIASARKYQIKHGIARMSVPIRTSTPIPFILVGLSFLLRQPMVVTTNIDGRTNLSDVRKVSGEYL